MDVLITADQIRERVDRMAAEIGQAHLARAVGQGLEAQGAQVEGVGIVLAHGESFPGRLSGEEGGQRVVRLGDGLAEAGLFVERGQDERQARASHGRSSGSGDDGVIARTGAACQGRETWEYSFNAKARRRPPGRSKRTLLTVATRRCGFAKGVALA